MLTLAALALIAHCLLGTAAAGPLRNTSELPLPAWSAIAGARSTPSSATSAIDGDTVLVGANRAINVNNDRVDGVYIFQRATNGNWNYAGPLVEGQSGAPLLNGNLATVRISRRSPGVRTGRAGLGAERDDPARPA